jgi:hypothetical protein
MGATAAAGLTQDDSARQPHGHRKRSAVPWGLLAMLALVWSIERCFERHAFDLDDYMAHVWRFSREAIAGGRANAPVLCFGDSLVKVGVLPGIMEPELGRSAYNLAVFAGQPPSSYFLLRRALDAGHRPQAVVIDFAPNLLMITPKTTAVYWTRLVSLKDWAELMWYAHSPSFAARTAATWLLPSYKNRQPVRQIILASLRGERWAELDERRSLERNLRANLGALAVSTDTHAAQEPAEDTQRHRVWKPHPVNARFAKKFVDLATAHGIQIFILIPPATPEWQARREQNGLDAPYTRFIQKLQQGHANVVVIDGRHSGYAGPIFSDPTHLNRAGAISLSHALAERLSGYLPGPSTGPRWAELPAYRAWPDDRDVEDISQSRVVIRELGRVQR